MSPDELFLRALLQALARVGLEAIVVGGAAAALQGAPVMTQDVDLLVRDTERNRAKIAALCEALGGARAVELSPLSRSLRLIGLPVAVDILFDEITGGLKFEALRARCVAVAITDVTAAVASLEDVIASKEAADRPKDRAQLPILRDTLRVKRAIEAGER